MSSPSEAAAAACPEPALDAWRRVAPPGTRALLEPGLARGLAHLAPCLGQGAAVLDLGCGSGYLSYALGAGGVRCTAVDADPAALANTATLAPAARRVRADAERLPFRGGAFDALLTVSVMQYVDWRRALRECARVLRPGGRAFFLENLAGNPLARGYRLLRRASRSYGRYWTPRRYIAWAEREEFARIFPNAEFEVRYLLVPLALALPALRPRHVYAEPSPLARRVFAALAATDARLLARWPGLAALGWSLLVLAEKAGR